MQLYTNSSFNYNKNLFVLLFVQALNVLSRQKTQNSHGFIHLTVTFIFSNEILYRIILNTNAV